MAQNSSHAWLLNTYEGPWFNVSNRANNRLSEWQTSLSRSCSEYGRNHADGPVTSPEIANCILNNLAAITQSNAASHSYILTLWPTVISIIVAVGPDGNSIVYDDILWSGIFALSSGALSGSGHQALLLPHQFETTNLKEAQKLCESWQDDDSNMAKSSRNGKLRQGNYASDLPRGVLAVVCLGLWTGFVAWYFLTLQRCFYYSPLPQYYGELWYLVAIFPSILKGIHQMALNNVELWVPLHTQSESVENHGNADNVIDLQEISKLTSDSQPAMINAQANFSKEPQFCRRKGLSGLQTWFNIAYLQISRQKYRILVRPTQPNLFNAGFDYFYHIGKFILFTWGSAVQGSIIFMPTPTDYGLLVLLVLVTMTPRLVWPHFWSRGRFGADLVVWFKPAF